MKATTTYSCMIVAACTLGPVLAKAADLPTVTMATTPEAMALGGLLVSRAESVGAMATNPAAFYLQGSELGRRFQLGAHQVTMPSPQSDDDSVTEFQGGFAVQNETLAWGGGIYSQGTYIADGRLASNPAQKTVYEQSVITFGAAMPVKQFMSLGFTLDAMDLTARNGEEEYSEDWGLSLGALITPEPGSVTLGGQTLGIGLQAGLSWSDEVRADAENVVSSIGRRDLLVRPATLRVGLEPALFWLSGSLSSRLRFPVQAERRDYTSLQDFYLGAADQSFTVDVWSVGAEWEWTTAGSPWSIALRGGTAVETSDLPVFNEVKRVSVGLAVNYGPHNIALGSQADDRDGKQASIAYQYWF